MNELPVLRPKPRKRNGGATTLQKGLSAEMRSYIRPPLQHELNQIIHSNDAPHTKFGMTPNAYRDYTNQFDPKAQKEIDRAIAVLVKQGIIPPPPVVQLKASAPVFVPTGKGLLGSDPATYTPAYLSQGGAVNGRQVFNNYSTIINHLISHITDPKEPVDPRDYKHTIRLINGIRQLKGGLYGGAEPSEANTPDDYYAVEPEYHDEEGDGMEGIDWNAIGQALMNDALEGQPEYQGDRNALEP